MFNNLGVRTGGKNSFTGGIEMYFHQLELLVEKGEVPAGCNILLVGPSGSGKTVLCDTLLCEGLEVGQTCLYITMKMDPNLIRKNFLAGGVNLSKMEFLDCFTWLTGQSSEHYSIQNLTNLSELSVRLVAVAEKMGEGIFFILDSVSNLCLYNVENTVLRFLEVNMARMKRNNNVGFYLVTQGIHSEAFYNGLRQMSDAVIEIRLREEENKIKREIRMHTFKFANHDTGWFPLIIDSNGKASIGFNDEKII